MRWIPVFTEFLAVICAFTQGAKILIYPYGHCFSSLVMNAEKLGDILSSSGHQVDLLVTSAYHRFTREPQETASNHFNVVSFPEPENFVPVCEHDTLDYMLNEPLQDRYAAFYETSRRNCDLLLTHRLASLKAASYDLVIVEMVDPCSRILVDYLDEVPHVLLVSLGLGHIDHNPRPPSYLPAPTSSFSTDMDFRQRMVNTILKLMYDLAFSDILGDLSPSLTPFEELKIKHGMNTSSSLSESFDKASLRLVNSDFTVEYPAPVEPDTILVGGFFIDTQTPPLAKDLEDFIEGSGDSGVILMSFGALTTRFDDPWAGIFAEVFSRLPQRVVWKYDGPLIGNETLGSSIKLVPWLPQVSILSHPKTKLFVSNCGTNSVFEAVHFGKPVLGIPLSGDQINNAAKISEHMRMGLSVDIHTMTPDSLFRDIQTVLGSDDFAVNARVASSRLTDQPMSARDKIKFWIDYVIRNRNDVHLRSTARQMPWYQYLCIDVIACVLAVILVLLALVVIGVYLFARLAVKVVSSVRSRRSKKTKIH